MKQKSSVLNELCKTVREYVQKGDYKRATEAICEAMKLFPHAPQPHNLYGIVLEKIGDHMTAMRHFVAATALDPSYAPANHNLNVYGTFFSDGNAAFDETDIPRTRRAKYKFEYNEFGTAKLVRK